MARPSSKVCPHCGALCAGDQSRCYRCERRIGTATERLVADAVRNVLGEQAPVTRALALLCAAVFVFMTIEQGQIGWDHADLPVAAAWGALIVVPGILQPIRYLSASFVHFGVLHLVINALMLVSFGRELEQYFGGRRLAVVFLSAGFLGFFASDLYYGMSTISTPTAGASAGVAGLLGSYLAVLVFQRNAAWKRVLLSLIVYVVVFALAMPGRINHVAHAGGFAAGWLLAALAHAERRRRRRSVLWGGAAWALAVATVLSIVAARFGA